MNHSESLSRSAARRKSRSGRRTLTRRLRIEALEERRLLATFTVTSLNDAPVAAPGAAPGTLRQAIFDANQTPGVDDTILFHASLTSGGPATINLSNAGQLVINSNMTIIGPGSGFLTVRAFDPTPAAKDGQGARVLSVVSAGQSPVVEVRGLRFIGGDVTGDGGAILNQGNLTLFAMAIADNTASGAGIVSGGGIANAAGGTLTIDVSTLTGNVARGDFAYGGGVSSSSGVVITRSLITNNRADASSQSTGAGGGLFVAGTGTAQVSDSAFTGNMSLGIRAQGGAISAASQLTVARTMITGNQADAGVFAYGGGIAATAQTTVSDSQISGNEVSLANPSVGTARGGGIDSRLNLTVTESTISGNHSDRNGGGLALFQQATVSNSTISGNTAAVGGGISVAAGGAQPLIIRHATITANRVSSSGGGVFVAAGASATLGNSIVAGNFLNPSTRQDISGAVTASYTLIGDNSGATVTNVVGNLIGTAAVPINPQLGPLASNGGTTLTHVPLVGSPVIDAGDPAAAAGVGTVPLRDQRGAPFTRVFDGKAPVGARIDMGAVEWQAHPVPLLTGDYNRNGVVDAADYTLWRNTSGQMVEPFSGADADGNGLIQPADYQSWKTNFGNTFDSLGNGSGGGSQSLAGTVESEPVVDVRTTSEPVAIEQNTDRRRADIPLGTARHNHPPRTERPRIRAVAEQLTDQALVAWLATRRDMRRPSTVEYCRDEEPAETSGDRSIGTAADSVFAVLGSDWR